MDENLGSRLKKVLPFRFSNGPQQAIRACLGRRWAIFGTFAVVFCSIPIAYGGLDTAALERTGSSLSREVRAYAEAHERSRLIRASLQRVTEQVRPVPSHQDMATSELRDLLLSAKRDYFRVRADLFVTIYAHASTIVEDRTRQPFYQTLGEIALTLAAATDLVTNADAIMMTVSVHEITRSLWNEQDETRGIPGGSLDTEVATDLYTNLHDMFRAGLPLLEKHRPDLEQLYQQSHANILPLFPDGVNEGLGTMASAYRTLRAHATTADLAQDDSSLRTLVNHSKQERAAWQQELTAVRDRLKQERGVVRGDMHVQLNRIKRAFLDLREKLLPLAFKHVSIVTRDDIGYPPDLRLRAIGLSLLAAATLYENASLLQTMTASVSGLKELLNQPDPSLGIPSHFWDHIEREYARPEYRKLFAAGLQALETGQARLHRTDPFLTYVVAELDLLNTPSHIREEPLEQRLARVLHHYQAKTVTTGLTGIEETKFQTSKGFGNLVGAFEFRKGKLYDQTSWIEFVQQRVRPGDILLEKTPFRITDKFIPGHFGHVAIYVGSEEQLRNLGLLRDASIAKYQPQLGEGRSIVEALREGTQINTVSHFLNVDDLAILRPKPGVIPQDDILQAIALAFTHIGKKYDFGFDTNTWDTIVCSELAFQTYVNIRWPFGKTLGSYTISPDDVAVMAGSDPSLPFQLISFVHDGQVASDVMTGVNGEKTYRRLIEQDRTDQASLLQYIPNPSILLKPLKPGAE